MVWLLALGDIIVMTTFTGTLGMIVIHHICRFPKFGVVTRLAHIGGINMRIGLTHPLTFRIVATDARPLDMIVVNLVRRPVIGIVAGFAHVIGVYMCCRFTGCGRVIMATYAGPVTNQAVIESRGVPRVYIMTIVAL